MFKKLKLKLMITYCVSMLIIIIISFSTVFYISYSNYKREVNIRSEIRNDFDNMGPNRGDIVIQNSQVYGDVNLTDNDISEINNKLKNNDKYIKIDDEFYYISQKFDIIKLTNITQNLYSLINLAIWLIILLIIISIIIIVIANILTSKLLTPVINNYKNQKKFVSDASHELKTPLQVLKNSLLLVKEEDDEKEKWLDYSIKETDRLTKLTSNLLTLSRDKDVSNAPSINISLLLEEFIAVREVLLFEDGFNINYEIDEDINIKMYEDDFIQIITNLIDNAVKYNDHRLKITIELKHFKNETILTVSNTTEYIDKNKINKLDDRFYKIDESHNSSQDSFGLGLSIVKQIINQYNLENKINYDDSKFNYIIYFK